MDVRDLFESLDSPEVYQRTGGNAWQFTLDGAKYDVIAISSSICGIKCDTIAFTRDGKNSRTTPETPDHTRKVLATVVDIVKKYVFPTDVIFVTAGDEDVTIANQKLKMYQLIAMRFRTSGLFSKIGIVPVPYEGGIIDAAYGISKGSRHQNLNDEALTELALAFDDDKEQRYNANTQTH